MSLLEEWRAAAYGQDERSQAYQTFWANYFKLEEGFYASLLADETVVTGTIPSLAEKYNVDKMTMVGILDETTELSLDYDKEKLYYNMVEARAEWLYNLPQWDNLLTEERRKELYKEQKSSTTVVKPPKIGRNDPCPCGSGKKYKKCCGKNL